MKKTSFTQALATVLMLGTTLSAAGYSNADDSLPSENRNNTSSLSSGEENTVPLTDNNAVDPIKKGKQIELYGAIIRNNLSVEAIMQLISDGADINPTEIQYLYGFYRMTPLEAAAECYRLDVVKALLAAGADVNAFKPDCRRSSNTPLHFAVNGYPRGHNPEIIPLLLDAGVDVEAINYRGNTALDEADLGEHRIILMAEKGEL